MVDMNNYLLIIPLEFLVREDVRGYKTLNWCILEDRYVERDGKLFFEPYYTIPLDNSYEAEIVRNEDGSVDHLTFIGDMEYCQDIIDYFNIINPQLTVVKN